MKWLVALSVGLSIALIACGGGKNEKSGQRVLRLGGGDMTATEFRMDTRVSLTQETAEPFCRSLRGLSDEEAGAVIVEAQRKAGGGSAQEADPQDRIRAAAIVKEECERIFTAP